MIAKISVPIDYDAYLHDHIHFVVPVYIYDYVPVQPRSKVSTDGTGYDRLPANIVGISNIGTDF